jgi:hypothetical protein
MPLNSTLTKILTLCSTQAFGSARGFENWHRSQVIGLRKDVNDQYEALVCFGSSKEHESPHEEWIPQHDWRFDRILNRSAFFISDSPMV